MNILFVNSDDADDKNDKKLMMFEYHYSTILT